MKEELFLSRTQLCMFNQQNRCRYGESECNYAHCLDALQVPEESQGNWSEAWRSGHVDINFWHNYWPSRESVSRFRTQFLWELKNQVDKIPNWAWGYALQLRIIHRCQVPAHIPQDYDWTAMQQRWSWRKLHRLPTAFISSSYNFDTLWRRQHRLRQAWQDLPQKGKGTVKGETGQGKGMGQKGKGNGKGMDQGEKGKGQGQCTVQGNVPPPASVTRPNLDSADPTPSPNADVPLAPDKMRPNEMSISPGTQTEEEPKEKPEEVPCHEEGPPPPPPVPAGGVPSEEPTPPPPPPTEGPPLQGFQ